MEQDLTREKVVLTIAETQFAARNPEADFDSADAEIRAQYMLAAERSADALHRSGLIQFSEN